MEDRSMRSNYDFSKLKAIRNPYVKYLKQPVTIRLDKESIAYFQSLASETGLPYQQLINLYLRDCAASKRKLALKWTA
jgi:predicted DNA binding CopG/RHH family protein